MKIEVDDTEFMFDPSVTVLSTFLNKAQISSPADYVTAVS